jgi:hypothetical protein
MCVCVWTQKTVHVTQMACVPVAPFGGGGGGRNPIGSTSTTDLDTEVVRLRSRPCASTTRDNLYGITSPPPRDGDEDRDALVVRVVTPKVHAQTISIRTHCALQRAHCLLGAYHDDDGTGAVSYPPRSGKGWTGGSTTASMHLSWSAFVCRC